MSGVLGAWVDGVPADSVPADDRGLHYGDGLFETLLVRAGRARFLEAHLARLSLGCARLGIQFDAMRELRAELAAAVAQAPALAVIKVIVTRGSATRRGYAPQGTEQARRLLSLWPAAELPASLSDGASVSIATLRLAENPALAGIKHLNRLENVLAAAQAGAAVFETLLLDASGHLVCGAMSNVFVVKGGRVATPRVDRCGVAGVIRGVVLREGAALGIAVSENRITLEELLAADEAFITNARLGVVPIRSVGQHSFLMQDISLRLRAHIEGLDA